MREAGLEERLIRSPGAALELRARAHAACVNWPVPRFEPAMLYRVTVGYRTFGGATARVCVWEEGTDSCAALPALDATPGWHVLRATVTPLPGTTGLRIFVYAFGGDGETVTAYRDISVRTVAPIRVVLVGQGSARSLPAIETTGHDPAAVQIRVSAAREPFLLVLPESYADGWKLSLAGSGHLDAPHVVANGYANGWLISRSGSYELVARYAPERLAHLGRVVSVAAFPIVVFWLLAPIAVAVVGRARPSRAPEASSAPPAPLESLLERPVAARNRRTLRWSALAGGRRRRLAAATAACVLAGTGAVSAVLFWHDAHSSGAATSTVVVDAAGPASTCVIEVQGGSTPVVSFFVGRPERAGGIHYTRVASPSGAPDCAP